MAQADPTAVAAVLRALASAANAVRLYPSTSHLPQEALGRFVELATESTTALGFLRFTVDPAAFKWGDELLGVGNAQIEALAHALYAHQAGQLVIAPDLALDEARTFIEAIDRDKADVKDAGGLSRALVDAGVSNIAVVEMSVRASQEEGLAGVDLLAAPLDEIGEAIADAAQRWADGTASGMPVDEATETLGGLAAATQDIAASRITDALLRLDEATRTRVLSNARERDASGQPMEGMLKIIGQMSPSALARLLTMVASQAGEDPRALLPELELPPDAMKLLTMMLSPSPQTEMQRGVPETADHVHMASVLAVPDEAEEASLEEEIQVSAPALAAGRALATACFVAMSHAEPASVEAIGNGLAPALRSKAFAQVGDALVLLDEYVSRPDLTDAVAKARRQLADPELLADSCAVVDSNVPTDTVAQIVTAAGEVGFEVLATCWTAGDAKKREILQPVVARLADRLVIAAGKVARSGDTPRAREAIGLLASIGDSRAVPLLSQLSQHDDVTVRIAAVSAIADIGGAESGRALAAGLEHNDEDTRIAAAREIARAEVREALPGLITAVEKYHLVERDAAFKTEVIRSIVTLEASEGLPALKRIVTRGWAFGSGNRVVRDAARQAIATLKT